MPLTLDVSQSVLLVQQQNLSVTLELGETQGLGPIPDLLNQTLQWQDPVSVQQAQENLMIVNISSYVEKKKRTIVNRSDRLTVYFLNFERPTPSCLRAELVLSFREISM